MIRAGFLLFFLVFCCKTSFAADPLLVEKAKELTHSQASADTRLNLARVYFYLAVEDPSYIERTAHAFEDVESHDGITPITKMYRATILGMRADQSWIPTKKRALIDEALGAMEDVVANSPSDYEVLFLRASTWHELPFFFHKKTAAGSELQKLVDRFESDTTSYPDYVRLQWLDFFLSNMKLKARLHFEKLYTALGGKLGD